MRYLVEMVPTNARALEMEERGGPGPALGHIVERFKPEAMYMHATNRACYMVVDLDTQAKAYELMLIASNVCGQEPKFTPVVPAADGAKSIPEAIAHASKAPKV